MNSRCGSMLLLRRLCHMKFRYHCPLKAVKDWQRICYWIIQELAFCGVQLHQWEQILQTVVSNQTTLNTPQCKQLYYPISIAFEPLRPLLMGPSIFLCYLLLCLHLFIPPPVSTDLTFGRCCCIGKALVGNRKIFVDFCFHCDTAEYLRGQVPHPVI